MQGVDLFSLSVSLGEVLATLVAPELPILGTKLGRVDRELNLSLVDSTNYKLEASVSEVICGYYGNDCLEILNSVLGTSPEDINRRSKDVAFKNFRNSLMTYLFASL